MTHELLTTRDSKASLEAVAWRLLVASVNEVIEWNAVRKFGDLEK